MPRAHRHFVPGHIWHFTHRCHNRDFLFEEPAARIEWLSWLRKAQKRFRLPVLGYCVTCNHIHLLAQDPGIRNALWRSMQLIQGQTAQSHNRRTKRKNAFWGDRYHATAVESGVHLRRCLAYIDLNMVRAGLVSHPEDWPECSYNEICDTRLRSPFVDRHRLAGLLGCSSVEELAELHRATIKEALQEEVLLRDDRWTEPLAVGGRNFVETFAAALADKLKGRQIREEPHAGINAGFALREARCGYGERAEKMFSLQGKNLVQWEEPRLYFT
ncbi:MAG: transposase [Chitinivibrionales bacterium]|nr:transposase [Chitinivibrionales bacterium]MBD3357127.1 transposase [Chitinivibrionales bacterium]